MPHSYESDSPSQKYFLLEIAKLLKLQSQSLAGESIAMCGPCTIPLNCP